MVFFQPCLLPGMVRLRWFPIFCAMVHGKISLEECPCSLRFRQMKVTIVGLFDCLSNSWLLSLECFFSRNKSDELWITACTAFERLAVSSIFIDQCLAVLKRLQAAKHGRKAPERSSHSFCVDTGYVWDVFPRISRSPHWINIDDFMELRAIKNLDSTHRPYGDGIIPKADGLLLLQNY